MKAVILFFVIGFVFTNPMAYTQTISGKVSATGFSKDGTIKEQSTVELFKSFKENKYKIGFTFAGWGTYPPQQPLMFDMKTTVKKNGKIIGISTRPGWPWLPGDMFVPAEAFDFIPMLQKEESKQKRGSRVSKLTASYEIILEMIVSSGQGVKGTVDPLNILLKF